MRNHSSRIPIALLPLLILPIGGCNLEDLFGSKQLTKAEIKREIKEIQPKLPIKVDEVSTVTKLELDYGGQIEVWVEVNDDVARQLRAVGSFTLKEAAKAHLAVVDVESMDFPKDLARLFEQEDVSVHYIFEDKYGSHLFDVGLNKEAFDGKERVGKKQKNPFAVRNVSRKKKDE